MGSEANILPGTFSVQFDDSSSKDYVVKEDTMYVQILTGKTVQLFPRSREWYYSIHDTIKLFLHDPIPTYRRLLKHHLIRPYLIDINFSPRILYATSINKERKAATILSLHTLPVQTIPILLSLLNPKCVKDSIARKELERIQENFHRKVNTAIEKALQNLYEDIVSPLEEKGVIL